jgi:FtsH-binding integral membrane protein
MGRYIITTNVVIRTTKETKKMRMPKSMNNNLGMLLLAIWLILMGLSQVVTLPIPSLQIVLAVLAIAAGVLLLMKR